MSYKYSTYKFYAKDKRRIAAFAEETEDKTKLKVYLFYCSKKDAFCKKEGHANYLVFKTDEKLMEDPKVAKYFHALLHPEIIEIDIDPTKPKKSFVQYMHDNFYVMKEEYHWYVQGYLYKKGEKAVKYKQPYRELKKFNKC